MQQEGAVAVRSRMGPAIKDAYSYRRDSDDIQDKSELSII